MSDTSLLKLYDLEGYLFDTVRQRFHKQGFLSAFDFFCIVIWKANRAKSKIAQRLLARSASKSLDIPIKELTSGLYQRVTGKDRFLYLIFDWGFYLPMASAIMTVLYPDELTVYDTRVCGLLNDFYTIGNTRKPEKLWKGYEEYREAVIRATPEGLSLRNRDRFLWAKSFAQQLETDLETCFSRENNGEE